MFADLSRAYIQKSNLECVLPISTERLGTTDECLMKSLGAMVSATGKVGNMIIFTVFRSCSISYRKGMVSTIGKVGIMIIFIVFRSYGISYRKGWNNDNLRCL